jgi:hypothetical protein
VKGRRKPKPSLAWLRDCTSTPRLDFM